MLDIKLDEEFVIKITGAQLQIIVLGLGELVHKVAAPVEFHLSKEVTKSKMEKEKPDESTL